MKYCICLNISINLRNILQFYAYIKLHVVGFGNKLIKSYTNPSHCFSFSQLYVLGAEQNILIWRNKQK